MLKLDKYPLPLEEENHSNAEDPEILKILEKSNGRIVVKYLLKPLRTIKDHKILHRSFQRIRNSGPMS